MLGTKAAQQSNIVTNHVVDQFVINCFDITYLLHEESMVGHDGQRLAVRALIMIRAADDINNHYIDTTIDPSFLVKYTRTSLLERTI